MGDSELEWKEHWFSKSVQFEVETKMEQTISSFGSSNDELERVGNWNLWFTIVDTPHWWFGDIEGTFIRVQNLNRGHNIDEFNWYFH